MTKRTDDYINKSLIKGAGLGMLFSLIDLFVKNKISVLSLVLNVIIFTFIFILTDYCFKREIFAKVK